MNSVHISVESMGTPVRVVSPVFATLVEDTTDEALGEIMRKLSADVDKHVAELKVDAKQH